MTIEWDKLPASVKRQQLWAALRSVLTPENYESGKWTLTEIITGTDTRIQRALEVLDGLGVDGKRGAGILQPRVEFRFKVLSRQACCRDKKGRKIWFKSESLENSDTDNDIVAKPDEEPKAGDIVEWKGNAKLYDEQGAQIDSKTLKRWSYMGIRSNEYLEFEVDKDGCIRVPYPWAYSMLAKFGKKISKPKFRKKSKRTITNWFFEEVPFSYTTKKKPELQEPDGEDNKEILA